MIMRLYVIPRKSWAWNRQPEYPRLQAEFSIILGLGNYFYV